MAKIDLLQPGSVATVQLSAGDRFDAAKNETKLRKGDVLHLVAEPVEMLGGNTHGVQLDRFAITGCKDEALAPTPAQPLQDIYGGLLCSLT